METSKVLDMKKNKGSCDLQSCFFCTRCLPEWIPAVAANRDSLIFRKGERIFSEGDKVKGIYFITSGKVKVHKQWGAGKELILRFASTGDLVGHRGLADQSSYPISATALDPVNACFIGLDFLRTSLKVNQELGYQLLLFVAAELQESEIKMRNLAHMQVKGRIAQALLALRDKFGVSPEGFIHLALSRQDLASFAGTTYETVFRIINELAQEWIIQPDGKNITILDEKRLKEYTRETAT
jgi:CRP-like cAMP-binding protein